MNPGKALIIVHDGFTDSEFTYAYYRCREEGIVVMVATLTGKNAIGEKGQVAKSDMATDFAQTILWDILILPGGVKSIEKVRQDVATLKIIKQHHESGKIIGSICHSGQLLIESGLAKNRKISGYYSIKTDIINAGGEYFDRVITDGNLVSAPHYDFNGEWMKTIVQLWREKQLSRK